MLTLRCRYPRTMLTAAILMTVAAAASAVAASKAADVDAARLSAADPEQWLTPGRDANGTFYSPLKDIDARNIGRLGFAWDYRLGTRRGQESTPLVIDGVMYATSNFGRVYALDAATGRELWTYAPQIDGLDEKLRRLTGGIDPTLIPGFTDRTFLQLVAEVGLDMSRWATSGHFTSWLGVAPGVAPIGPDQKAGPRPEKDPGRTNLPGRRRRRRSR